MASENAKSGLATWSLGPLVAVFVILFTFTEMFDRAELVTYDQRFRIRNDLFGPPPMDPRLGTIDIDNLSITEEGRYQDWTRDKYSDVVNILAEYDASLIGFDVYFIEPSTKLISEEQVLALSQVNEDNISSLFATADHDENFRQAIARADNVYLAQMIVVSDRLISHHEVAAKMKELTPDDSAALEIVRQNAPVLTVPPQKSTIWRGHTFEPPLELLRNHARGFAYAQTKHDVDGGRRRYPVVYQYDDFLFPSIALLMICDLVQIPIGSVEVTPGEDILLPNAKVGEGEIRDIRIPIDDYGNMNVNWAGRWDDTFAHFPHIGLRWTAERQRKQDLFDRVKALVAVNPSLLRNPRGLPAALAEVGFANQMANRQAVATWFQASGIERAIRADPDLPATDFWKSKGVNTPNDAQTALYDLLLRTNRVADLIAADPSLTHDQVQQSLPDYRPIDVAQSDYLVRSLLVDGAVPDGARPLFFYPYTVYEGQLITPDYVKDKVLFYGLTADGTTDLSVTPFQGSYPMVGIYPNVLNTILQDDFIRSMPRWLDWLIILALGVLITVIVPRFKALTGAAVILSLVLLYILLSFFAFTHAGTWIDMVGPFTTLIIGYLALTIYAYVVKEKEKDFVQGAFGHYLSPAVVDQIMNNPDMINHLGGQERVMTAFFSDIASFSTISECLTPVELVNFINGYLSEMCDIIEFYGGTIDKFEGDAIVAFFGAPVFYEDHAVRATMACIDQQHKLVEMRERWRGKGVLPPALIDLRERWESQERIFAQVRIGITAGPMVVGNMGSKSRTDYTMMGDTVNLAARFESGQKIYGTSIMVNDVIYEQVKEMVEARKLDMIQVMGKEQPVVAYEILDRKGGLSPEMSETLGLYNDGMAAYEAYNFDVAQSLFEKALKITPKDGPSGLYADRCGEYAITPPPDLIFRAETK